MKIFCGKESKSIPKIHPHKASHPQILITVGSRLSFKCCKYQAGLEEWSPKWKIKNVCVTLLWHFNLGLLCLWDRSLHINRFAMCCSYMAQDKMNCCKLETVYKQITEINNSLEANEHALLANPKRRPSSTLPPVWYYMVATMYSWLMALPAETWVCASH